MTQSDSQNHSVLNALVGHVRRAATPEPVIAYALGRLSLLWRDEHRGVGLRNVDQIWERTREAVSAISVDLTDKERREVDEIIRELDTNDQVLSAAFEALMTTRSETLSRAALQSMSSRELNWLIGELSPQADCAFDPACGMGGTLAAVIDHAKQVVGYELDPLRAGLLTMLMTTPPGCPS